MSDFLINCTKYKSILKKLKSSHMKKLLILLLVISNVVFAGEQKPKSKITRATVFPEGAQVTRESKITIPKGKTTLIFNNLSPYIDKNSIKVKGLGDLTILSVNHSINRAQEIKQSPQQLELSNKILKLKENINYKNTEIKILNEKHDFLTKNKTIVGSDKSISPTAFKQFMDIYYADYDNIQKSLYKKQNEIKEIEKEIKEIQKQISEYTPEKALPTSEITVEVSSTKESKVEIIFDYFLSNAGWHPSYDIRVDNIHSPMKLYYKANVYQNTGVDWNNIILTFSNATPTESAEFPDLNPYYLSFNNYNRNVNYKYGKYDPSVRAVSGIVRDKDTGEPIPFANIVIEGTTIGTTSDYDGRYSLYIPEGSKSIKAVFVGYKTTISTISSSHLDIMLESTSEMLDEVVVVARKIPLIDGIRIRGSRSSEAKPIPVETDNAGYKTNFEFEIGVPYTLKSKANNITVEMNRYDLNSSYVYKSIPKINPKAFLIANVTDWEELSLLDGEVNLYFENTYVGKSLLDLSQISDTLQISLGSDKNISVKRKKVKTSSSKQFLGSNKIESRIWKTSIKNNKSEEIKIIIYDQIPVSNNEEIVVEPIELSAGVLNDLSGEVMWEMSIKPKESKELNLEYKVKYPKKKQLIID